MVRAVSLIGAGDSAEPRIGQLRIVEDVVQAALVQGRPGDLISARRVFTPSSSRGPVFDHKTLNPAKMTEVACQQNGIGSQGNTGNSGIQRFQTLVLPAQHGKTQLRIGCEADDIHAQK